MSDTPNTSPNAETPNVQDNPNTQDASAGSHTQDAASAPQPANGGNSASDEKTEESAPKLVPITDPATEKRARKEAIKALAEARKLYKRGKKQLTAERQREIENAIADFFGNHVLSSCFGDVSAVYYGAARYGTVECRKRAASKIE